MTKPTKNGRSGCPRRARAPGHPPTSRRRRHPTRRVHRRRRARRARWRRCARSARRRRRGSWHRWSGRAAAGPEAPPAARPRPRDHRRQPLRVGQGRHGEDDPEQNGEHHEPVGGPENGQRGEPDADDRRDEGPPRRPALGRAPQHGATGQQHDEQGEPHVAVGQQGRREHADPQAHEEQPDLWCEPGFGPQVTEHGVDERLALADRDTAGRRRRGRAGSTYWGSW